MNRIEWPILSHSDPIQFSQVPPLELALLSGPFAYLPFKKIERSSGPTLGGVSSGLSERQP
jgi:hypothetical protein